MSEPIVRGKAGSQTESGAKVNISLIDNIKRVEQLDREAYNEGTFLIPIIESYQERTDYYPDLVQVDGIFLTRANRKYKKERNIRHTGKPLGRRVTETRTSEQLKTRKAETAERNQDLQVLDGLLKKGHLETVVPEGVFPCLIITPSHRFGMEGVFGVGKRRYLLDTVKARLSSTSKSWISAAFFAMNLMTLIRHSLLFVYFLALYQIARRLVTAFKPLKEPFIAVLNHQVHFQQLFHQNLSNLVLVPGENIY